MKRMTLTLLFVFVPVLVIGAAAMAHGNPGVTASAPGGFFYCERQTGLAGKVIYAQAATGQMEDQGPGMSNATGLPALSGNYSSTFESGSMQSAQQVCNEAARINGKTSCQATPVTTQGTSGTPPRRLYYCICK